MTAKRRCGRQSLRVVGWVGFVLLSAQAPAARAWNPLKSAGKSLGAGAIEAIQPALAGTISDVDTRLNTDVDKVGDLANKVLISANSDVTSRVAQVNDALEARITQADTDVNETLGKADGILARNINRVDEVVKTAIGQADGALADRIEQVDETISRSLGNVDVIATKQRLAIEQTLLRVAVLIGLVVFVVIVLVRLWRRYGELAAEIADPAFQKKRSNHVAKGLASSLALQIGAAGLAASALFVLYRFLPLGAARQADQLVAQYSRALDTSLATFDFTRVRFNASQLQILQPDQDGYFQAMAFKGDLIRDVLQRPTVLSTPTGVASIMNRVNAIQALLGEREDPDLLVIQAVVSWQIGRSRDDEHEAASLCAQALRADPGGFALAPLAGSYVESFLSAPYLDPERGMGPEAESVADLTAALTAAATATHRPRFPMAVNLALDKLVRELDRASARAYVGMLEAHADVIGLAGLDRAPQDAKTRDALDRRTKLAKQVVAAWDSFTSSLQDVSGLAGTPALLSIFTLNDAYYTRAKWFVQHATATELPPLLAKIMPVKERHQLAPPRVAWRQTYKDLLATTAVLFDYQESRRWQVWEEQTRDFDVALLALRAGGPGHAEAQYAAALAAARLGLYVHGDGADRAKAYALKLVEGANLSKERLAEIDAALSRRSSAPPIPSASSRIHTATDQRPASSRTTGKRKA